MISEFTVDKKFKGNVDQSKKDVILSISKTLDKRYGNVKGGIEIVPEMIDEDIYNIEFNAIHFDIRFNIQIDFEYGKFVLQDHSFGHKGGMDVVDAKESDFNLYSKNIGNYVGKRLEFMLQPHFNPGDYDKFVSGKDVKVIGLEKSGLAHRTEKDLIDYGEVISNLDQAHTPEQYADKLGMPEMTLKKIVVGLEKIINKLDEEGEELTKENILWKLDRGSNIYNLILSLSESAFSQLVDAIMTRPI